MQPGEKGTVIGGMAEGKEPASVWTVLAHKRAQDQDSSFQPVKPSTQKLGKELPPFGTTKTCLADCNGQQRGHCLLQLVRSEIAGRTGADAM